MLRRTSGLRGGACARLAREACMWHCIVCLPGGCKISETRLGSVFIGSIAFLIWNRKGDQQRRLVIIWFYLLQARTGIIAISGAHSIATVCPVIQYDGWTGCGAPHVASRSGRAAFTKRSKPELGPTSSTIAPLCAEAYAQLVTTSWSWCGLAKSLSTARGCL